ncbi:MAG: Eco57I restriction-modification methylase domain-containing protein [Caldilineaceae bacterium]|nr:Eco57I restriction-modification methylase domain-containing protein [Caldilineaceae bacterium]
MPTTLDRARVKQYLDDFDLRSLFTQELGWDYGGSDTEVAVKDHTYFLQAVAQKRGFVVYLFYAQPGIDFPDHPTRQQIERGVAKEVREHLIIFCPHDRSAQYWFWVKREPGRAERSRTHIHYSGQRGEPLIQKLEQIVFTLDEEADITIVDPSSRVRAAFDVEKVTRSFYDRFKKEQQAFLGFIEGVEELADREWYASLMLNRLMFIYFIQKRRFLDDNLDYLHDRLHTVRQRHGTGRFASFYRIFLLKLFHEGLGQPEGDRDQELTALLGQVPYLNGGLFDVHDLERDHPDIDIPDEAFERIFAFFDAYQWHLDDRPLRNDNEINPDVLGFIFEKYINQKQMGAYYTKDDITGYISRNTIIPFLFDRAQKACPIAFQPGGGVWRLLQENPDGYFYEAVRHGITYDIRNNVELVAKQELPEDIAAGLDSVAHRGGWNEPAPEAYALPTETWREHVARRRRYQEIHAKLAAGEVTSINDLITYNLNIEKFAHDVIANSEGPELVRAFWKAIVNVSVLDPTCGSGAFLFAALNILEPLYSACLESMEGFLDDLKRSQRPRSPQALSDFRRVMAHVAEHANPLYFILKSTIINNLYGVDIMEEAVEICKLRLFLKLVAQLETYDQIEPLPDIDFNVRAGNTLVGFTTLQEIKKAAVFAPVAQSSKTPVGQGRMLYADEETKLDRIDEDAELADRAFSNFRKMQTGHGMDASKHAEGKLDLQKRLAALRAELDRYLATEYAIGEGDEEAYVRWRSSHQPFHWFVEFYGIMRSGGFDVIIGNPPYVEYRKVSSTYTLRDYATQSCGNLYAYVLERCKKISHRRSQLSMIVPLSGHSTKRMIPLMDEFYRQFKLCYLFNISADANPSILFPGVKFRLAVFLVSNQGEGTLTTGYTRWYAEERSNLFSLLNFAHVRDLKYATAIPKVSERLHLQILRKLDLCKKNRLAFLESSQMTNNSILFHSAPVNWIRAHTSIPYFHSERDGQKKSVKLKPVNVSQRQESPRSLLATVCSTTFFIWWLSHSDCYDLNKPEIFSFPMFADGELERLAVDLERDMKTNSKRRVYHYRTTGRVEYDEFYMKQSKAVIDEIDRVLAEHYGFTDEELDFIINYDIKYRMGR